MSGNMNDVTEQKKLPSAEIAPEWLSHRLPDRSMRGIAIGVSALIRAGDIPVGVQLPSVRALAWALGVSPATVSAAWKELRQYRVISGRGRTGMRVTGDQATPRPLRFADMGNFGQDVLDLTMAVPDPALLPPLAEALAVGAATPDLNSYRRAPILPELERVVRRTWPHPAASYLATNGGYEAVNMALQALTMPGSVLAIENPTALRLLDITDHAKAHAIPVGCDGEGPRIDDLAAALARRPSAFLFQPRTHSVTGVGVTATRLREMVRVLRGHDVLIIEDDGLGDLSSRPPVSLAAEFPRQTIHIRSYSKSLGPDMRLAVVSGPQELIERMHAYRSFGAGWTSRILQAAAAWLMTDTATAAGVDVARRTYAARRRALLEALDDRGIALPDEDGLCLWAPVISEQYALLTLAARRISVMPGSKCLTGPGSFVRIATSLLASDVEMLAEALALVMPGAKPSRQSPGPSPGSDSWSI